MKAHNTKRARNLSIRRRPVPGHVDWRCVDCHQLLGVLRDGQIQIRFSRGADYIVSVPAAATCSSCGAVNTTMSNHD